MIPIILITKSSEKVEKYIQNIITEEKIKPYLIFKFIPEKTEFSIEQIRLVKRELITATNSQRLFVLYAFETATLEAQNALLKTLEEKNGQNIFILVCASGEAILPTIRSRSKVIVLDNQKEMTVKVSAETKKLMESLEKDDFGFLGSELVNGITREKAINLFDEIIMYFRTKISETNHAEYLKLTLETKNLLVHNNLNPQLAVDSFLIYLKKSLAKK